jgi:hypothetical protein
MSQVYVIEFKVVDNANQNAKALQQIRSIMRSIFILLKRLSLLGLSSLKRRRIFVSLSGRG